MTRRIALAALLALVAGIVPWVASAQCEFDGSIPGTTGKTYPVSASGQTIYVDDRDYADLDDDGVAGGLWLYYESNRVAGLQRGGSTTIGLIPDPCQDSANPDLAVIGLHGDVTVQPPQPPEPPEPPPVEPPPIDDLVRDAVQQIDAILRAVQSGNLAASATVKMDASGCEFDGSVPGTTAKVYAVGAGGQTIYIDDRDHLDLDNDGVAGGLWLYYESNKVAGLQRGGDQVGLGKIPGTVPYVPPTYVVAPDPNRPVLRSGVLLFPSGFGGGSIADAVGEHDPCTQSATPDTILF